MTRTYLNIFGFGLPLAVLAGCTDLVVREVDVTWNAAEKQATAEVANQGTRAAGPFLVYFDADEDPISPNHRPQLRFSVPGLDGGETVILSGDFAPLAHPDNGYLGNVYRITVTADPKNTVEESNEGNNTKSAAAGAGGSCIGFGPPPAAGTQYGTPAGQGPGTVVLATSDGIEMSVETFRWTNGGTTFNRGRVEVPPVAFGSGQALRSNNLNFEFDFTGLDFPVSRVTFDFLDMGGSEDLSVNGQPVPVYAGDLTGAPSPIGGVVVQVTSTAVPGGKRGTVTLTGTIERIRIGGQEFWLDNVCAQ
ncbi:CARDB protein [Rhodovulum sp. ES.010]|uniref:CARDB domain-containing protein n=1 Tax=Rhodovulum sp. ES.010 TaxID=1882821 RepID=UPI00092CD1BC|nr:CARDB domain-containing protein [Rhodovulum sp. ES.010]SIO55773.1 CARDB protein [Rhodovulum sp. ES.010]